MLQKYPFLDIYNRRSVTW